MNVKPDRPGTQTTEFWTNVFLQLLTAVTTLSAIFGHAFDGARLGPLVPMAALIAAGVAQAYYSHSRATVKAAALANVAVTVGRHSLPPAVPVARPSPGPTAKVPPR